MIKAELRQVLLAKRRQITLAERQRAAIKAAALFVASDCFHASQHIACYYASENEFDCAFIINEIWAANKKCYLPQVTSKLEKKLDFVLYPKHAALQKNRYGILEPVEINKVSLAELDVVLLPLVGFDLAGNRLGMGGGYYDRTFAARPNKNCPLIGLGYDLQKTAELPKDPWDITLDSVITEKNWLRFPLT
jgi:5-formyltetrahydrofolate cyclo-ligase